MDKPQTVFVTSDNDEDWENQLQKWRGWYLQLELSYVTPHCLPPLHSGSQVLCGRGGLISSSTHELGCCSRSRGIICGGELPACLPPFLPSFLPTSLSSYIWWMRDRRWSASSVYLPVQHFPCSGLILQKDLELIYVQFQAGFLFVLRMPRSLARWAAIAITSQIFLRCLWCSSAYLQKGIWKGWRGVGEGGRGCKAARCHLAYFWVQGEFRLP